jgi:hypothetical protein
MHLRVKIQEVLLFVAVWILLYITSGRWSVVAVIISAIVAWVQYQLHSLPTGAHGPGCIPSNFAAGLRIETNLRGRPLSFQRLSRGFTFS